MYIIPDNSSMATFTTEVASLLGGLGDVGPERDTRGKNFIEV